MYYKYEKGKWETKEHKILNIEDMETQHIENTIMYLKRNPRFYEEGYYDALDLSNSCYEPNYDLVKKKIQELQEELDRRKK